jgi:gamma-polyglutamate synthase
LTLWAKTDPQGGRRPGLFFYREKKYNNLMNSPVAAAVLLALFLAALIIEKSNLKAARRRVPLIVAVTGTRGKSTVTRLLAAAFREQGLPVLAKTTGSKPVLIGFDGGEMEIIRTGPPSILEQKRVLRTAAREGAGVLVAEMMSIRPECLKAEAAVILKPDVVVVTNARIDHREEMGRTKAAAAAALASAIRPGCTVFLPAEEAHPAFDEAARRSGATLILVPPSSAGEPATAAAAGSREFPENVRLALAVAEFRGVPRESAVRGLAKAVPDFGALRIWRLKSGADGTSLFAVSVFAANEPESSRRVLERLEASGPELPRRRIGILNLREDREDRTRQWLDAAGGGFFAGYDGLIVAGRQAAAAVRRLRRIAAGPFLLAVPGEDAGRIMAAALSRAASDAVLIGFGNIGGAGGALVELWAAAGEIV